MEFSNPEEYFANTHNSIAQYLNVVSYEDMMVLFVWLEDKSMEYELTEYEQKALEIIHNLLCYRFNKCVDWDKEDPFEDFRPML